MQKKFAIWKKGDFFGKIKLVPGKGGERGGRPIAPALDAFLPKFLHFVPMPYHSLPSASGKQVSVLQTALCGNQTILSDSNCVSEIS